MLVWLIALFFPVLVSMVLGAAKSVGPWILPDEVILAVFANVGFAGLYKASCVSKNFCTLARQVSKAIYGIEHEGRAYLNYTAVLYELDALVQDAGKEAKIAQANVALQASPDLLCIRSTLEAEFGYCIRYAANRLPAFSWIGIQRDALNDKRRISVLPYVLDQMMGGAFWIGFIQGLAERGRFDLLGRLTFQRIDCKYFKQLMSVVLPESVLLTAVESLQRNQPNSELLALLASIGFGPQRTLLPEHGKVPLFILRYLYEKDIPIPEGCIFTCGLKKSSISFWGYVSRMEFQGAERLLELILRQGDDETKCLARVFYEPVIVNQLRVPAIDLYQAMLVRFRFSPICNECVFQNYTTMLEGLIWVYQYTACAFIDCGQCRLASKYDVGRLSGLCVEQLIAKLYQSDDENVGLPTRKLVERCEDASVLLKSLIQRRANDSFIQLVWECIQGMLRYGMRDACSYSIPLETLKRLVFEQEISVEDVENMLGMLNGFRVPRESFSKEEHVLYTVMFWGAPEGVVEHFLGLVPMGVQLGYRLVWEWLLLTKYSSGLGRKFAGRLGNLVHRDWRQLQNYRPDLFELDFKVEN